MGPNGGRGEITDLLQRWSDGDPSAGDEAVARLYDDLHRIAKRLFRAERPEHTLSATAVLHEAWLRLQSDVRARWPSRTAFLAFAATVMRRVLVDHARRRSADKRGGDARRVTLIEADSAVPPVDVCALDEALTDLARLDERKAQVVELRFFGGLTGDEIAEHLQISSATVAREWRRAKAWLYETLTGS